MGVLIKMEIPAHEKWLFDNKIALKMIKAGLEEAKRGNLHSLGSFAKYLKEDDDSE